MAKAEQKMPKHPPLKKEDAIVRRRTLCVVVDETGHEEFKSEGNFFAIGGVMGLGAEIVRASRRWHKMKERSFGGISQSLHASGQMMSRQQIDEVSHFFATSKLVRFAYIIQQPPILPPDFNAINILRPILLEDLLKAVGNLKTLPDDILLMMEYSERLAFSIMKSFAVTAVEISDEKEGLPTQSIPVTKMFTPKSPPNSLLEMADHVAWRAQRQYKVHNPRGELMDEYGAVFKKDAPHSHYRELKVASMSGKTNLGVEWQLSFEENGSIMMKKRMNLS